MNRWLSAIFLFYTIPGFTQPPSGYYDPATGLSGTSLQSALHNVIKDHTVQTYASLYQHFQITDNKGNNQVWDMYSDVPGGISPYVYFYNSGNECGNYNSEGDCYNREHSFPTSWFGGNILPMYSDLFHIYPTDGYVNNRRANYPFGTVSSPSWTSMNGSKLGPCTAPGYTGVVFEPINEYKGDFARTMFYMAVRYYGLDTSWPGSPMADRSQLKPWAWLLMRQWHLNDPVSTKEIQRNNAVFGIQGNRNPFIDRPEFADAIWGNPASINFGQEAPISRIFPSPAKDFCYIKYSDASLPEQFSVVLTDLAGKSYSASASKDGGLIRLDLTQLKSGVYLVKLNGTAGHRTYARLLKL